MRHAMRLNTEPFEMIKNGKKTVELRLYDEKRRLISCGDSIEFINASDDTKRLICNVRALHLFDTFEELYSAIPLLKCGYTERNVSLASHSDMEKYYTREQQKKYGVVGIEIELNKQRNIMKNSKKTLDLLNTASTLVAEHTELMRIPFPRGEFTGFQGGCSDGERYYYQVLMHYELSDRTKDYSCIAKVDLKEKKVIKYSGILNIDHANDMTYHPKKNLLIVANNKPHPTRITLIDPETLEIVGYEEAPLPIYAIEYVTKYDKYVVGMSGTRSFCYLDADFKLVDDKSYRMDESTDRYTKQGLYADDDLIYFILWDGKHKNMDDFQNIVSIYGYNGEYKGVLNFNLGVKEPENLSVAGGELLAICGNNTSGPIIYHFEPKIK